MKHFTQYVKAVVMMMAMVMLIGCNETQAPAGDNGDVEDLVIDILMPQLKNTIAMKVYKEVTNDTTRYGFDYLVNKATKHPKHAEFKEEILDAVDDADIELANIRYVAIDNLIMKSASIADVMLDDEKCATITYTAQATLDGNVWVEVSKIH